MKAGNKSGVMQDTARMLFSAGAFNLETGITRAKLFEGMRITKETAVSRLRALQWEGYAGRYSYSPRKVVWWLSERGTSFISKESSQGA